MLLTRPAQEEMLDEYDDEYGDEDYGQEENYGTY